MISLLKNIKFWIIIFLLVRMFGITNAPLEMGHSWRQTLTNMVSRNLLEVEPALLYPRVDMDGDGTGIIGAEFPAFNYLIYIWYKFFGFNHWIGRLINLVISSIGIYFFYRIVRRFFTQEVAFSAAIILLVSGWFGFARKIMPDTVSVSLVLIGLFYAIRFLDTLKKYNILLFVLFAGLGGLIKMPAVIILSVLIIPVFDNKYEFRQKVILVASGMVVLFVMSWWYFYWVPHLLTEYGYKLFFPRSIAQGFYELYINWFNTLDKFFFASFFSYVGFFFFLVGFYFMIKKKNKLLQVSMLLISSIFFIFMMKTGDVFSFHSYYIIPYTPLMALLAGYGLSQMKIKWQYVFLAIISIEAIANQQDDFFIKDSEKCKLNYEQIADDISNKNDLVIVTGGMNPITMYYLHRKGWSVYNDALTDSVKMEDMHKKGAKYVFVDRRQFNGTLNLKLIKRTDCLDVYDFN